MQKTSEDILVRPISGAGFSDVASIEHADESTSWPDESLASELTAANAAHFGLYSVREGRLLTFVLARVILDEVHIHRVCTHPDYRRAGYAGWLLRYLLDDARSRGAQRAFLEVASSNAAALALYRRTGFIEDSVRVKYYSTGDEAIVMSKPLVAPEPAKGSEQ